MIFALLLEASVFIQRDVVRRQRTRNAAIGTATAIVVAVVSLGVGIARMYRGHAL